MIVIIQITSPGLLQGTGNKVVTKQ